MTDVAVLASLVVAAASWVWSVVEVRRARREAEHASEVAAMSVLVAVAAAQRLERRSARQIDSQCPTRRAQMCQR